VVDQDFITFGPVHLQIRDPERTARFWQEFGIRRRERGSPSFCLSVLLCKRPHPDLIELCQHIVPLCLFRQTYHLGTCYPQILHSRVALREFRKGPATSACPSPVRRRVGQTAAQLCRAQDRQWHFLYAPSYSRDEMKKPPSSSTLPTRAMRETTTCRMSVRDCRQ